MRLNFNGLSPYHFLTQNVSDSHIADAENDNDALTSAFKKRSGTIGAVHPTVSSKEKPHKEKSDNNKKKKTGVSLNSTGLEFLA
jgi:hypothetical protein